MVIWSEFRMEQNRDDDHREDAPHFTILKDSESEHDSETEKPGTRKKSCCGLSIPCQDYGI